VIREDIVFRCGPLGGVYTALATSRARSLLFLPCDMPFVSRKLLETLARRRDPPHGAVFVKHNGRVGFPFLLRRAALPVVRRQIASRQFSLKHLARELRVRTIRLSGGDAAQLFNINTPEDLQAARDRWRASENG
jgi:molybdopterin-guanine dinucleotide biosynthesis protein A